MSFRTGVAGIALATVMSCVSMTATAEQAQSFRFDLPQQDLATSLRAIARLSGRQVIIASDATAGKVAPALRGDFSADEAIRRVLRSSGVPVRFTPDAVLVGEPEDNARADAGDGTDKDVVVTGTRIRSAAVVSPITVLTTRDAMKDGQTSVASMIATVPQNFGGGQNPGVGMGLPKDFNETGASSLNLRGLGSDATLTLIDGHRVAYGGSAQSIDVSSIPFLAIERIEIVPDGSSALYGSDAVAGVANVILKRRFEGAQVAASVGIPTSGGGLSQQYDAIAGTRWKSGGLFAAYEYTYSDELSTDDRASYRAISPGLSLFPALEHHNVVAKLDQEIADGVEFDLAGFFNHRTSVRVGSYDLGGNYKFNGQRVSSADTSFAIVPTLRAAIGASWNLSLSGSFAQDHSHFINAQYISGTAYPPFVTCYCNETYSGEVNAEGPLLSLPAGMVRLAVGAGYRSDHFRKTVSAIDASQSNHYLYGELDVPVIAPAQDIPGIELLSLNLAARYEKYPGVGEVVTPRVGIVYSPVAGVSFKGTWGESFRAPTLFQKYDKQNVYLYPARSIGYSGPAASPATLLLMGGNLNLKPERAKTLSATIELKPVALPNAHLEISYFQVRYRDRIVTPITYLTQALSNPYYSSYVHLAPTAAEQAAAMTLAPFSNLTGAPYDPANVVAIVYNNNVNAERQFARGVDVSADYRIDLARNATLQLLATGSYLDSDQYVSAGQPREQLAGRLYHPPHFRGRAGARYDADAITLSGFVNYIGGVTDARTTSPISIPGMTTADFAVTVRPRWSGWKGFEATLAVENITNVWPTIVKQPVMGYSPFDSTNYSPIGRKIAFTITNKW